MAPVATSLFGFKSVNYQAVSVSCMTVSIPVTTVISSNLSSKFVTVN